MALYIPQSILHLARSLYVRPETYGPNYVVVCVIVTRYFVSLSVRFVDCSDKCLLLSGTAGTEI